MIKNSGLVIFLEDALLASGLLILLRTCYLLFHSLTHGACNLLCSCILPLLLISLILISICSIVQVLDELFYLFLGLLFCDLFLEVEDDVVALPHFFQGEEVVEEVLQLIHTSVEELV